MPSTAILLIAHGSRLEAANEDLAWLAGEVRQRQPAAIVATAYLEIAEPDIPTAAAECVERGAGRVILVPFFLSPGRHASLHLAEHRDWLAEQFPEVNWELRPPLGRHAALVDVVIDRLADDG